MYPLMPLIDTQLYSVPVADNRAVADGSTAEPDAEAAVAPEWDY